MKNPTPATEQLFELLEENRLEKVKALLAAGADPNGRNAGQETPLMKAAYRGDHQLVELLLAHGAQINLRDAQGRTALLWAMAGDHHNAREASPFMAKRDLVPL